ncbi:MAG: VIT1/CCC1 transporter family protein [Planctomycetaceae bacterium]|nr:VIT1/CCC1 transporter family protein [Planctomycetaceae bacterium]
MSDQLDAVRASDRMLREMHSPAAIRSRLDAGPQHSYLKDFIYGAIDGAVTTFAVVSGVAGAGLSSGVIVILGVANLVGDGLSMAARNFLGTRAERQHRDRLRRIEEEHIDRYPDGEREEIRQILRAQGFVNEDLDRAVEIITSDRQRWIETMLKEEHGVPLVGPIAWKAAAATFVAFVIVGSLPLLPFLINPLFGQALPAPYLWSTLMTGTAFFAVGAAKARFVDQHWHWSGLETLLVGGIAAGLAYLCGVLLKSVA